MPLPLLRAPTLFALLLSAGAMTSCTHAAAPKTATSTSGPAQQPTTGMRPGNHAIDAHLREEWAKAGVVPAPRADDATFLRRVYVDIVGTIPPADVTTKFLGDAAPNKRERLVEALLASREYVDHWTNYWDDVLMGEKKANNLTDRTAFREWLHGRFVANTSWDRLVTELISATGQNGDGNPKVRGPAMQLGPANTETETDTEESELASPAAINGAVNWTLRYEQTPQDLGGSASRLFLGVQIQCAQCHDHKTEKWKQEDFRRFSSAFFRAKVQPIDKRPPNGQIKRVELVDATSAPPRFAKKPDVAPLVKAKATALDGTDLERGKDTRKALAAWMTSKKNPWFAKAFVNRMWGHFLGRGFYDPIDDIRPSNAATAPELLDRVAADFAEHDFDVKYLVRTICATEAYQLAAERSREGKPTASPDPENKLWGRFHLVPLGPEELLNALLRATDLEKTAEAVGVKDRDALRANIVKQYAFLFDTDEDDDEPDYSGTVSQALALLNGSLVRQGGRALPGSMLRDIVNGPGSTSEKVDRLAITVLSRHATTEERDRWARYIDESEAAAKSANAGSFSTSSKSPSSSNSLNAPPRGKRASALDRLANRKVGATSPKQAAYEDVLWTMLNSSEFTFNH